jgi:four helix bundle protein
MRNQEQGTGNKVEPRSQGFRSLLAWQKADELAAASYRSLSKMARQDRWLALQAMRAAVSVPANIAEGYGRGALGDYLRFIDIARGSLAELEYYIHFLAQQALLGSDELQALDKLQQEADKLLHGLWRSLKEKARNGGWDHTGLIRDDSAANVTDLAEDGGEAP